MRVSRSKQNWVPRKLFSLEPGKLVLCICTQMFIGKWDHSLTHPVEILIQQFPRNLIGIFPTDAGVQPGLEPLRPGEQPCFYFVAPSWCYLQSHASPYTLRLLMLDRKQKPRADSLHPAIGGHSPPVPNCTHSCLSVPGLGISFLPCFSGPLTT